MFLEEPLRILVGGRGFYDHVFCDHETLPSYSVHMGLRLICPLAEYTVLKDVLNKKELTKKKKKKIVRAPPLPESMRMAEVLVICL